MLFRSRGSLAWLAGPVSRQAPEGTIAADYDIYPRDRYESSVIFQEFYAPRQFIHSMGGVILTTPTGQSAISAHRSDDAGPFGEKEKTILRSLMPPQPAPDNSRCHRPSC